MRVFVLTTGRSGSTTFAAACSHLTNFTSGHESRWNSSPHERLEFPDGHIEIDNRLTWFSGMLHARYPAARYVHLTRDPDMVARSFQRRWAYDPPLRGAGVPNATTRARRRLSRAFGATPRQVHPGVGAVTMFAYPMFGRSDPWPHHSRLEVCRMFVDVVNSNIAEYLRDKPHLTIDLADAAARFPEFSYWIGGVGDVRAGVREFTVRRNATDSDPST
jgi:hypothetical protein